MSEIVIVTSITYSDYNKALGITTRFVLLRVKWASLIRMGCGAYPQRGRRVEVRTGSDKGTQCQNASGYRSVSVEPLALLSSLSSPCALGVQSCLHPLAEGSQWQSHSTSFPYGAYLFTGAHSSGQPCCPKIQTSNYSCVWL
jgi:hypothetical protein